MVGCLRPKCYGILIELGCFPSVSSFDEISKRELCIDFSSAFTRGVMLLLTVDSSSVT